MMDTTRIRHFGDELYAALVERKPIAPLTDRESGTTSTSISSEYSKLPSLSTCFNLY